MTDFEPAREDRRSTPDTAPLGLSPDISNGEIRHKEFQRQLDVLGRWFAQLLPLIRNLGIVPSLGRLRTMNDAELKVGYNAVMAEYMRRRRAKHKAT